MNCVLKNLRHVVWPEEERDFQVQEQLRSLWVLGLSVHGSPPLYCFGKTFEEF